jgi:predicted HicB family RNase H-like nuclease
MKMPKETQLLATVRKLGESAANWADFANALFDQKAGLLAKAFPTKEARTAFIQSEEYRQIKALMHQAQMKSGLVEGATPSKSGRLLVRLPKSMHQALALEADAEGVSLNQLVVAKLAMPISRRPSLRGAARQKRT